MGIMKAKTNIIEFNPETVVIDYNVTEAGLSELRKEAAGLKASDKESYKVVTQVRSKVRNLRVGVEKMRVDKKKDALEYGRRLDAEAKRVTILLEQIENPLKAEIDAWDNEQARIKLEKEKLDRERMNAIIDRIERIKNAPLKHQGKSAAELSEVIDSFNAHIFNDDFKYDEFEEQAQIAKVATGQRLREMLTAQVNQEAEAIRLAAERKQLEEEKAAWEAKKAAEAPAIDITQPRIQNLVEVSIDHSMALSTGGNATLELKPYQQEIIADITTSLSSGMPLTPGAGKSNLSAAIAQVEAARPTPKPTREIPTWAAGKPTYNELVCIVEQMLPRINAKTQEEFEFYENVKKALTFIRENN